MPTAQDSGLAIRVDLAQRHVIMPAAGFAFRSVPFELSVPGAAEVA
jgi:hypothetical protein